MCHLVQRLIVATSKTRFGERGVPQGLWCDILPAGSCTGRDAVLGLLLVCFALLPGT